MSQGIKIPLTEGDTVRWPFQLKRAGTNVPPDVSGATSIVVGWELPDGTTQTPINLLSGEVGADWSTGLVVAVFSPLNVTAVVNDYEFALTVTIGGEEVTYEKGTLEVSDRPGYPAP